MRSIIQDRLEEIMQAAEEVHTASEATLDQCGFANEDERMAFIKAQSAEIIKRVELILGYKKECD